MNRRRKDRMMATRILCTIESHDMRGKRCAVVGNTQEHSEQLIALVQQYAKEEGVDISSVTLVPVGGDRISAEAKQGKL